MKKNKIIIGISLLIVFWSCSNEGLNTYNANSYSVPKSIIEKVNCINGILQFVDIKAYEDVLNQLAIEESKFSDNELKSSGCSYNKVLKQFESNFEYISKRSQIELEINGWLNNEELNIKNDPDSYLIADEYVRTLLNENNEVIIGNSIFKFNPKTGEVYEITDLDFSTLSEFEKCEEDISFVPNNVFVHGGNQLKSTLVDSDSCRANISVTEYVNYDTGKKVKCKISVNNIWPLIHNITASMDTYKSDGLGWDKEDNNLRITLAGKYRNTSCYYIAEADNITPKYINLTSTESNSSEASVKLSVGGAFRIVKKDVVAIAQVNGEVVASATIDW